MSTTQPNGPSIAKVRKIGNSKNYDIDALLDELDMRDKEERSEFVCFLLEYMALGPDKDGGYSKAEHARIPDADMECYAKGFLDKPVIKYRKLKGGEIYFPRRDLDGSHKTSPHSKKWTYAQHRHGIIEVVTQIMLTQKEDVNDELCHLGQATADVNCTEKGTKHRKRRNLFTSVSQRDVNGNIETENDSDPSYSPNVRSNSAIRFSPKNLKRTRSNPTGSDRNDASLTEERVQAPSNTNVSRNAAASSSSLSGHLSAATGAELAELQQTSGAVQNTLSSRRSNSSSSFGNRASFTLETGSDRDYHNPAKAVVPIAAAMLACNKDGEVDKTRLRYTKIASTGDKLPSNAEPNLPGDMSHTTSTLLQALNMESKEERSDFKKALRRYITRELKSDGQESSIETEDELHLHATKFLDEEKTKPDNKPAGLTWWPSHVDDSFGGHGRQPKKYVYALPSSPDLKSRIGIIMFVTMVMIRERNKIKNTGWVDSTECDMDCRKRSTTQAKLSDATNGDEDDGHSSENVLKRARKLQSPETSSKYLQRASQTAEPDEDACIHLQNLNPNTARPGSLSQQDHTNTQPPSLASSDSCLAGEVLSGARKSTTPMPIITTPDVPRQDNSTSQATEAAHTLQIPQSGRAVYEVIDIPQPTKARYFRAGLQKIKEHLMITYVEKQLANKHSSAPEAARLLNEAQGLFSILDDFDAIMQQPGDDVPFHVSIRADSMEKTKLNCVSAGLQTARRQLCSLRTELQLSAKFKKGEDGEILEQKAQGLLDALYEIEKMRATNPNYAFDIMVYVKE